MPRERPRCATCGRYSGEGGHWLRAPRVVRIAVPPGQVPLTGRELTVIYQLMHGGTNAQIARRLGLSANTVHGHVAAILAKTGARDRTHAVCILWAMTSATGEEGDDAAR